MSVAKGDSIGIPIYLSIKDVRGFPSPSHDIRNPSTSLSRYVGLYKDCVALGSQPRTDELYHSVEAPDSPGLDPRAYLHDVMGCTRQGTA